MAQTTTTSKRFTLNLSDGMKAFLMAVLTPIFAVMLSSLNAGSLIFDWHLIATSAGASAIGYITKNLFTPSAIVIKDVPPETVQAVKDGEAKVEVMNK